MSLTLRDLAFEKREAFNTGARFQESLHRGSLSCRGALTMDAAIAEAGVRYPLPKVRRARVEEFETFNGRQAFTVIGSPKLLMRQTGPRTLHEVCSDANTPMIRTAADAQRLNELFFDPTELVDDDEAVRP